jgi:hypothetical protein
LMGLGEPVLAVVLLLFEGVLRAICFLANAMSDINRSGSSRSNWK